MRWRRPRGCPQRRASPRTRRARRGWPGRRSRARRPGSRRARRPPRRRPRTPRALSDLDARAVEQPRGARAERAVHERLQVAEPQQVVAEAGAQPERLRARRAARTAADCQTRSVRPPSARRRWNSSSAPSQPSLSWMAVTPRALASAQRRRAWPRGTRRADGADEAVAERPRRHLAQDAGRLAVLVGLHDAARARQVAVGPRERRAEEPQRVVVARHQRDRHAPGRRASSSLPCRLDRRLPVVRAPAEAAQPAPGAAAARPRARRARAPPRSTRVPSRRHLALRQRPGREVHVRVGEAREHAAPAEVDDLRRARAPSRGRRRRRRCARRRSRAHAPSGATDRACGRRRSRGSPCQTLRRCADSTHCSSAPWPSSPAPRSSTRSGRRNAGSEQVDEAVADLRDAHVRGTLVVAAPDCSRRKLELPSLRQRPLGVIACSVYGRPGSLAVFRGGVVWYAFAGGTTTLLRREELDGYLGRRSRWSGPRGSGTCATPRPTASRAGRGRRSPCSSARGSSASWRGHWIR